ncbi:prenyltransferase/squalene oxidase repeat-containing protein [Streptomyces sp. NPDC056632]|uniref:prenyltransferase/squalene oxidase repeat-containing protein n=1 Tax=Streptomyces sp. NPDC056632 TaxID=3345884 RepID=UPI00368C541A
MTDILDRTVWTEDGGARQGGADLWCTYAAVRTAGWLGLALPGRDATVATLLARQNSDGGFAWQKGLPSDIWATYYCTQALNDLGAEVPEPDRIAGWLAGTQDPDGGFAMTPGQAADIWATYYAARTYAEILGRPVPRPEALRAWLAGSQRADGGLGWNPGASESDARACYYGAMAHRAAFGDTAPPWDVPALVGWLRERQTPEGGFVFDESATAACLWATFRAVRALTALGARPAREEECVAWIHARQLPDGGFVRWEGYGHADVWACFSAVGALTALGHEVPDPEGVRAALVACGLPEGGFTYRDAAAAGDSLATAAALILAAADGASAGPAEDAGGRPAPGAGVATAPGAVAPGRRAALAGWLRAAHLPYEGGVMYMPGRGAEVRCTLWAASALRTADERPLDADRLADWLRLLQNSDGGFGFWHGRGSDMVATVSALEILATAGRSPEGLDLDALRRFLDACGDSDGYRFAPGGSVTCAATAQAVRARYLLGDRDEARAEAKLLDPFRSPLGGFSAVPRHLPDLVSTYQARLTAQTLGAAGDATTDAGADADLDRFLAKVRRPGEGHAWSPLGRGSGGPLADALGALLERGRRTDRPLPALNL